MRAPLSDQGGLQRVFAAVWEATEAILEASGRTTDHKAHTRAAELLRSPESYEVGELPFRPLSKMLSKAIGESRCFP